MKSNQIYKMINTSKYKKEIITPLEMKRKNGFLFDVFSKAKK